MAEYVSVEEFEAMLAEENAGAPSAVPVFVAPKPTDRGFYARRERALEFSRQQMAAAAEVAGLEKRIKGQVEPDAGLLVDLDAALGRQKAVMDEQVEFVLAFVRAIKYVDTDPARLKVRPADGPERGQFEAEARTLLRECSQAEFEAMLKAAQGVGQAQVPPTSGGR